MIGQEIQAILKIMYFLEKLKCQPDRLENFYSHVAIQMCLKMLERKSYSHYNQKQESKMEVL